jgi:hypothetical protein
MEQKYPKFVVGAFVLSRKGKLLLWRTPGSYFTCPNFPVLYGKSIEETLRDGLQQATNLEVAHHDLIDLVDGLHIPTGENEQTNLIFADYRVTPVDDQAFAPSDEYALREAHWRTPADWLVLGEEVFGPYIRGTVARLADTG